MLTESFRGRKGPAGPRAPTPRRTLAHVVSRQPFIPAIAAVSAVPSIAQGENGFAPVRKFCKDANPVDTRAAAVKLWEFRGALSPNWNTVCLMFKRGKLAVKCLTTARPSRVNDGAQRSGIGIVSLLGVTRREREEEAFGK